MVQLSKEDKKRRAEETKRENEIKKWIKKWSANR